MDARYLSIPTTNISPGSTNFCTAPLCPSYPCFIYLNFLNIPSYLYFLFFPSSLSSLPFPLSRQGAVFNVLSGFLPSPWSFHESFSKNLIKFKLPISHLLITTLPFILLLALLDLHLGYQCHSHFKQAQPKMSPKVGG